MTDVPKIVLYRMGSDPEALFVRRADFDWIITPAYEILGRDKAKTTASFIGTDSRPVIMEIRPNPARNLKRHLYEIAYALNKAQEYVDASSKWKGLALMAHPHLLGENLGGHIHVSMFLRGPMYQKMKDNGYTFQSPANPGVLAYSNRGPARGEVPDDAYGPADWGAAMNYLLMPFEKWVQPWVAREQRNGAYGSEDGHDLVRIGTSKPPKWEHNGHYVHWEYRLPSTWLRHPWLAYAYLGLAKLSALNMEEVSKLAFKEKPPRRKKQATLAVGGDAPTQFHAIKEGDPVEFGKMFRERLARLMTGRPRFSSDIRNLLDVVMRCGTEREAWFSKASAVDVAAWRKML